MFVECCKNKRSEEQRSAKCTQTSYYNEDICCCSFSSSRICFIPVAHSGWWFSVDRSILLHSQSHIVISILTFLSSSIWSFWMICDCIALGCVRVCLHSRYVFSPFPFWHLPSFWLWCRCLPHTSVGQQYKAKHMQVVFALFLDWKKKWRTRYSIQSAFVLDRMRFQLDNVKMSTKTSGKIPLHAHKVPSACCKRYKIRTLHWFVRALANWNAHSPDATSQQIKYSFLWIPATRNEPLLTHSLTLRISI